MSFVNKLQNVGDKFKQFGDTLATTTKDTFGVIGDSLGDTFTAIGDKLTLSSADKDFERVKALNDFARQQRQLRKKITEQELQAAEGKAAAVISQLPTGYLDENFDPVAHELAQLSTEAGQEEIDALVEKLALGVEAVSTKLSRHVMTKRDKLLEGITTVASIEDDLKAALAITKGTRGQLRDASDEVTRNLRVAGQTRRKQGYLGLIEVCTKLQQARNLQQTVKRAQERGDYAEAILLCVQCFQNVDSLKDLKVSGDIRLTVQRLYVETLQKLDAALTNVCSEFDPEAYTKVLEGYMLQGMQGKHLAEKVLQCFKDSMNDVTLRVVKTLLLTKPKFADRLTGSSALDGSYFELCNALPLDLLRPCLLKLMEVIFEVLSSYHVMANWHVLCVEQQARMQQEGSEPNMTEDMRKARAAMQAFLVSVSEMMAVSRQEVLAAAWNRLNVLLSMERLCKGEDFMQMVEWCAKFVGVGEAFSGGPIALRRIVLEICLHHLDSFHRTNLEALTISLNEEHWKNASTGSIPSLQLDQAIRHSPLLVPAPGEPGAQTDFEVLLRAGNPFKQTAAAGSNRKQKAMLDLLHKQADGSTSTPEATSSQPPSTPPRTDQGANRTSTPGEAPSRSPPSSPIGARMLTVSSALSLKYIKQYCLLLRPLQPRAEQIFRYLTEFFDLYVLCTFMLFAGVKLEDLVWRDDAVTPRLKSTLIRILCAEGSIHKARVEELLANPPESRHVVVQTASKATAVASSFFDRFGNKMENLAGNLEQSFGKLFGGHDSPSPQHEGSAHGSVQKRGSDSSHQAPDARSQSQTSTSSATERVDALSPQSIVTSGNLYGLHERVVAADSLLTMAAELRTAKAALLEVLPQKMHREVEQYFSRTVEAMVDLKDSIFKGGVRLLLQEMLDPVSGTATSIANTNYMLRDLVTRPNSWADACIRHFVTFRDLLNSAGLPAPVVLQMWEQAVAVGCEVMLQGMGEVRRCSIEGRASMNLDLQHVERGIKSLAPQGLIVATQVVEAYVKAFWLPFEELRHWSQVHLGTYGRDKMYVLVESSADANKIRRQDKADLLRDIDLWAQGHL